MDVSVKFSVHKNVAKLVFPSQNTPKSMSVLPQTPMEGLTALPQTRGRTGMEGDGREGLADGRDRGEKI